MSTCLLLLTRVGFVLLLCTVFTVGGDGGITEEASEMSLSGADSGEDESVEENLSERWSEAGVAIVAGRSGSGGVRTESSESSEGDKSAISSGGEGKSKGDCGTSRGSGWHASYARGWK